MRLAAKSYLWCSLVLNLITFALLLFFGQSVYALVFSLVLVVWVLRALRPLPARSRAERLSTGA